MWKVFEILINFYGNFIDLMIVNKVYFWIKEEVDFIFLIDNFIYDGFWELVNDE